MKRLLLILLLCAFSVAAQPAFVNASSIASGSGGSTCTISSFTISAGSNLMLVVGISAQDGTAGDRVISTVTWNTSESLSVPVNVNSSGQNKRTGIAVLHSPTVTTADIVVTMAGVNDSLTCAARVYSGVDATTGTTNGCGGTGTDVACGVTTTADNVLVVDHANVTDSASLTVDGDQTQRYNGGGNITARSAGSEEAEASASTAVDMGWTVGASKAWSIGVLELKSASGGNSPRRRQVIW